MAVLIESAVRIIVLAAVVAAGLRILRIASPRVTHHAWTSVCGVMLLLPAIVAWVPEAVVPIVPPRTTAVAVNAPAPNSVDVAQPLTTTTTVAAEGRVRPVTWRFFAAGVYVIGCGLLLTGLTFGWWQARTMRRQATYISGRLTHPRCVTPVTLGLWSPVVILPPDWVTWHEADLAAVLAHEEEHVRRRDPMVAFVTLINRAVFWFHPLAWWLQREIAALSEQACDAAVVSSGHDEERYARVLMRFARAAAVVGGRLAPLGTAMAGAGLTRRLRMLEMPPQLPSSTPRTPWITAVYITVIFICTAATPTTQSSAVSAARSADWRTNSSEHFEVLYTPGQEDRAARVAREAEEAYARLTSSLKYDLAERVAVILLGPAMPKVEATTQDVVRRSGIQGRSRIVLSMDDPRPGAIVHELTHTFSIEIVPNIASTTPWLMEGFAEHTRGVWEAANLERVRRAVQADGIPTVTAMGDAHWGQALFDYIVAQSGEEGVRRFFFALRSRAQVGPAIQMAFGVSPTAFDQAFSGYVKDRFGVR